MSDLTSRLRQWCHSVDAVPATDIMEEAATEIERLTAQRNHWIATARAFDEHLATMRVMLMEQPGVRFGAALVCEAIELTDAEREAVGWAVSAANNVEHPAEDTLRGLLERLK